MGPPPRGGTHHVVQERSPPTPSASDGRSHSGEVLHAFGVLALLFSESESITIYLYWANSLPLVHMHAR